MYSTAIILNYLNNIQITLKDLQVLTCHTLQELERLEMNDTPDSLLKQIVTLQHFKLAVEVLEKRRSYKTYVGDFFQEMLENIRDLIPALRQFISTNRSTASLTRSIFKYEIKNASSGSFHFPHQNLKAN